MPHLNPVSLCRCKHLFSHSCGVSRGSLGGKEAWAGFHFNYFFLEKGAGKLVHWDFLPRQNDEGAMLHHARGKVPHDGFGLHMEVSKHLIGSPATNKLDDVHVDIGA